MGRISNVAYAGLASLVLAYGVNGVSGAWAADSDAVGSAGSVTVTVGDMKKALGAFQEDQRKAIQGNLNQLRTVVNGQLAEGLILNDVKAKKIDQQPDVVARLEASRRQILIDAYVTASVPPASIPDATDAEIRQVYENNKTNLMGPRQFHLADILIALDPKADAATQQAAEAKKNAVVAKLKNKGADFAAIAKTDSDQPDSAAKGGELPLQSENTLTPALRPVIAGLAKGAISEPIRLVNGWHIFKMLDVVPPKQLTLEETRAQINQKIKESKYNDARAQFVEDLLKKNNPALIDNGLSQLIIAPPK
jgi:peptidylprolyl isomerase